jgi:nucleotide-binding universal stress UspA family protein
VYKLILVPLDGSRRAEAILPHIVELAGRSAAEVLLLHVLEPTTPRTTPQGTLLDIAEVEREAEAAESYLAGLQSTLRERGITGRREIAYGPVVETITGVAERENVDLVAMASHGRSGLARVFYGSVAAGILHRLDRPLLLVRAEGDQPDDPPHDAEGDRLGEP